MDQWIWMTQVMRKVVEARNKKLAPLSNQRGISSSAYRLLQLVYSRAWVMLLKQWRASFAVVCENAYKDLHARAEEEKARLEDQENGRAPVADIASTEGN